MTLDVSLSIEADGWEAIPDPESTIAAALELAARHVAIEFAPEAEVSILLADDETIRTLNRTWRQKDKATNVLSFPAVSPLPLSRRPLLGDIAIAWETTAREAAADGKSVEHHLTHLAVHGFLHLIGYDHETEAEAQAMESAETAILAELGIADPHVGDLVPIRDAS